MRTGLIFIFLFGMLSCSAQPRQVMDRNLAWGCLFAQYNFTPSWNVNLDVQTRYEYTDNDWFTWFIRPGITWKAKNDLLLTAGVAIVALYPNPNSLPPRPEWRIWQEVGKKFVAGKHTIYPRFRFEQRFIKQYGTPVFEEDFSFNTYRSRIRCDYTYTFDPLKSKGFQLLAGNEYMISTDPKGKFSFDQNRAWAGVGYKLNQNIILQLSYLNLFLRKNATQFEQHHTIRLTAVLQFTRRIKPKLFNESGGN
jgi:hypothetical protein